MTSVATNYIVHLDSDDEEDAFHMPRIPVNDRRTVEVVEVSDEEDNDDDDNDNDDDNYKGFEDEEFNRAMLKRQSQGQAIQELRKVITARQPIMKPAKSQLFTQEKSQAETSSHSLRKETPQSRLNHLSQYSEFGNLDNVQHLPLFQRSRGDFRDTYKQQIDNNTSQGFGYHLEANNPFEPFEYEDQHNLILGSERPTLVPDYAYENPFLIMPQETRPSVTVQTPIDLTEDSPPPQTFEDVLAIVLEVLPDICSDHVRQKYDIFKERFSYVEPEALLADILAEENYPKRKKTLKRKRTENDEEIDEAKAIREAPVLPEQFAEACKILQNTFPVMPASYIATILKDKKSLYNTILTLRQIQANPTTSQYPAYQKLKQARRGSTDPETMLSPGLRKLYKTTIRGLTLADAAEAREKQKAAEDAAATERAIAMKDVSECQCCFDELPNAKIVVCNNNETPHTFCMDCLSGHVKAQLDLQKHIITCMDGSGCKAPFSRFSKRKALDNKTFERLERVQQQNELQESGLPLSKCPFCDFAALCPPVEVDRELRCQAQDCGVISCRLCNQVSHVPLTCEEYKKTQGVSERHAIEEEMTKAFLRECPKCKIAIVKQGGCNKITCSRCQAHICDVCGKDITKEGYSHFGRGSLKCRQMDENEGQARAAARVKEAEQAAKQQILAQNPDLSIEDLEIKMSKKVRASEGQHSARIPAGDRNQDLARAQQFHEHMAHMQAQLQAQRERLQAIATQLPQVYGTPHQGHGFYTQPNIQVQPPLRHGYMALVGQIPEIYYPHPQPIQYNAQQPYMYQNGAAQNPFVIAPQPPNLQPGGMMHQERTGIQMQRNQQQRTVTEMQRDQRQRTADWVAGAFRDLREFRRLRNQNPE